MALRATAPPDAQSSGADPWSQFVDVLLQRAALVARVASDRLPDPLAGLKVDDEDLARLLAELPGLSAASHPDADAVDEALLPVVACARHAFAASLDQDGPFAQLAANAQLDLVEAEVLAVVCAIELDPRRQRLVGYLNDDISERRVTPFLLGQLFGSGRRAAATVAPGGRLQRAALVSTSLDAPWASTPVTAAPAVAWWLAGDRSRDPDLPPGSIEVSGLAAGEHDMVTAVGPDRVRRIDAAIRALRPTVCLVSPVPDTPARWLALVRQATLTGAGIALECGNDLSPEAGDHIDRADHLAWALTSAQELPLASLPRRPWTSVTPDPPMATADEWHAAVGEAGTGCALHPLTAEQLDEVSRATRAAGGDLAVGIRRLAAGRIDQLAVKVRPARGWHDLVLPADRLVQVREVAIRYRHRDLVFGTWQFSAQPSAGVVALFSGPSGTGKTLAAEVVAGDLGLDLYKVDLANLVSKYIGETEKNLSQLFDAAEASNVVLFFDEADALLGKRSEVSDAHDRYANIEVAYLLQRLERHNGLVVLATNLPKNIDTAFVRRIHVSIDFPMPEEAERRRIWDGSLPEAAPVADLDLDFLASRFELSGGSIRNVALSAAFLAAEAGTAITMAVILPALQSELQKLGRLVSREDFGDYASCLEASGQ